MSWGLVRDNSRGTEAKNTMLASRWKNLRDSLSHLAALAALVGGCLVVSWELWPRLDHWQQDRLAAELASRVAAAPDDQVKAPLRQLAHVGTPALPYLVQAAAAEREAVARVAQAEIDIACSACLEQLREAPSDNAIQAMLVLVNALAENIHRFGPSGQRWAEGLVLRMIDAAEQVPPGPAATLLSAATQVLDETAPQGRRLSTVGPQISPLPPQAPVLAPPQVDLALVAEPTERVLTAPGTQIFDARPISDALAADIVPDEPQPPGDPWSPKWLEVRTIPAPPPLAGDASLSVEVDEDPPAPIDVPTPLEFERRVSDLRGISTDVLWEHLATADKFAAGAIRTVLSERGLNAAELQMTARLKSADEAERLRLVDEVSQLPAATARRMLRLLLNDPSGDVRLRALSTLATANDPKLAEVAHSLAIEDKDPRVAELASKLLRK